MEGRRRGEGRKRRPFAMAWPVAALSVAFLGACASSSSQSTADPTAPPSTGATEASATTPSSDQPASATPTRLRGGPGVSPSVLRRASRLLASTITKLPRFHTPAEAYAAGYRSIGDTKSVVEHYVNWSYVNDGHILDPARPESIVYQRRNGAPVAVAAMYSLPLGSTLADVPDVGGALTPWPVHRNLRP